MDNFNARLITVFLASFFFTTVTLANPVLGNVGSGNVVVKQTNNTTTINQSSQKAILNWQSFNIGAGEKTQFFQPTNGIALNRISPTQGASQIFGMLTATGRIILINPAGIYFGPNSYVNVGGLIATTSNITDQNFLSGKYIFNQASPFDGASIINQGTIIAAKNGLIALVGQNITNDGLIQANLGKVVLASGDAFTVDFMGDGMVNFAVNKTPSSRSGSVTNTGSLIANGGSVLVTAQQASGVLDNVINLKGVVEAKSVYQKKGEIIISGDPNGGVVNVAANINASGNAKAKGGKVKITGHNILLDSPTVIDVSGKSGGSINVGGDYLGQGPLPNANSVVMNKGATLKANALTRGNGGNIIVWSDYYTNVKGTIEAMGGSRGGNGGFVETSSHNILDAISASVNTSAPRGLTGTWLLDPANVVISTGGDSGATNTANVFTPNSGVANVTINTTTLATALLSNNITITTTNSGTDGGQAGTITISNPISWSSGNSLTLTAASNIIINAGITIGNSAAASLILNAAGDVTQSAAITGAGGLVKQGAGTFTASQGNSYTGGTTIREGRILVTNSNGLGTTGAISVTPNASSTAILDLSSYPSFTFANGSAINFNSSAAGSTAEIDTSGIHTINNAITLTGNNNVFNIIDNEADLYGAITGTGGLTKTGSGLIELFGTSNTYSGTTYINASRIEANAANSLSPNSAIVFADSSGVALNLQNYSNTVRSLAGGGGNGGNIVNLGSATLTIANSDAGSNTSYGGQISGGGSSSIILNLTGTGTPIQAFTGSNSYSSTITIRSGTLQIGFTGALSIFSSIINLTPDASRTAILDLSPVSGIDASSTFALDSSAAGSTAQINTSTGISLSNNISLTGSNNIFNVAANTTTVSGAITGGGVFTKAGAGILQLSGTSNTYSGTTTINAGILQAGGANTLSASSVVTLANVAGATLDLNNFNNSIYGLSGGGTTGGNVTLGSGTLTIANASTFTSNNYAGQISGTGGLTINLGGGSGPQILSGTNTYTGTTNILSGTLQATSSGALGPAGGGNINIIGNNTGNPTTLDLSGLTSLTNTAGTISMDSSVGSSGVALTTTANITLPNAVTFTGNNIFNNTLNVGTGSTLTLSGAITGTGDITKFGLGTLAISGTSNTVSSFLSVYEGTVQAGATNALSPGMGVVLHDNTTLDLNNFDNSINALYSFMSGGAVTLGTGTLTIANSTNNYSASFGGNISGSGGLTINLTGTAPTQTLSGTSDYTGTTTIVNGTLAATSAGALGPSGNIVIGTAGTVGSATLDLRSTSSLTNTSAISFNSSAGTAQMRTAGITLTNDISLAGAANSFNVNSATTTILSGAITGTGGLTKIGAGILQLNGTSNTYSGTTSISAGTLRAGAANSFSANSAVSLTNTASTILNLNGFNNSIRSLAGGGATGGNVSLGAGTLTIANADASSNTSYAGVISGTGGVTLNLTGTGTNVQAFTRASTYSGNTTITSGTFQAGANNALSASSAFTLANNANAILNLNNFNNSISSLAGGGTTGGNVTLGSGTLTIANATNGSSTSYGGVISGTGGLTLNLTGTGTPVQILTGANTYSGTTTITRGTLQAGAANALSANSAVSLANTAGAVLDLNSFNNSIRSLAGGGTTGGNVTLGSGTLTIANADNGSSTSFGGAITGTGGLTLNLTGTGTPVQILTGTGNTYSGTTTITSGTLRAGAANALSANSAVSLANTAGAVLDLNNFSNSIRSLASGGTTGGNVTLGSGTLTIANADNGSSTSYGGVISGTGGLTLNLTGTGTPVQILTGANTYSGTTTITRGTLQAGAANALSANSAVSLANTAGAVLDLNNFSNSIRSLAGGGTTGGNVTLGSGTLTIANADNGSSTSFGGAITGTGGLTLNLTGTGTPVQILTGTSNTYSGTTTITRGTLQAGAANVLSANSAVSLANTAGAVLDLNSFNNSIRSLAGGGTTGGNVTLGSGTLTIANADNSSSTSFGGAITGTGGLTLNLTGTGTPVQTLTGTSNTYSGTTTITSGTLRAGAINALSANSAVSLANTSGAVLDLNNFSNSIRSLADGGATGGNVTLGSGTLTIANADNGSSTSFGGAITGTGGLTLNLTGTGTPVQILTGANTYSGTTTITRGTLQAGAANALSANSAVSLANTAGAVLDLNSFNNSIRSLAGGGTTGGNVTLGSGTLTIANADNGSSTSFGGAITGTGGLTLNLTGTGTPVQTLTGTSNTYSGTTTITSGTLRAGAANALSASSAVSLANNAGAILDLNNFSNSIRSLAGGGTTGGNVTLGSGTLTIANADNGSSTSFGGAITGTGGLTLNLTGTGTPVQTLTGTSNTYSGTTTITSGILRAGAINALSANSAVSLANTAGAVLDLNNFSNSIRSLAGGGTTGGNVTLGSGTLTIANADNGSSTSFGGAITGTGGLTLNLTGTGTPVQILTGTSNTYSGTTTITNGTLRAGAANALSASSAVSLANNAGAILDLNNFSNSIRSLAGGGTTGGNVTLGSGTLTIANADNGSSTSFGGAITGTGGLTLNLTGTGTPVQTLTGTSNTYSGTTTITSGTLRAGAINALSANSAVSLANTAGAVLDLNNFSNSIRSLAGGGATGGNVTLGSGTLTIANVDNGSSTSFGGAITGTGGLTLNLTGTGTPVQILTGTSNTYSGTTTITRGTLQAGAANALSANSTVSLANTAGATLDLNSFNNSVRFLAGGGTTGGNVTLGSAMLTIANSVVSTNSAYAGQISGTGGLIINLIGTGGSQTLSGTNLYTGTTTIYAGTLDAGFSAGFIGPSGGGGIFITPTASHTAILSLPSGSVTNTATIVMDSSAAGSIARIASTPSVTISNPITLTGSANEISVSANNTNFNGAITGTGDLIKTGSGNANLGSTGNTYSGTTYINAGNIQAGAANRLSANSAVVLANVAGAGLVVNNFSNTIRSLSGGGTTGGNVTLNSGTLTIANADNGSSTSFGGAITGTGGLTINLTGTGSPVQILTGTSNTYSGTTTITNGTLQAGAANALSASSAVSLANNAGAILDLNNFSNSIRSLAGGGATGGNVTLGSGTLTIANAVNSSSTSFGGVISGTGGLTLNLTGTGTPTQTLTNTNTYSGDTNINSGTLAATVSGALGTGVINIAPSASATAVLDLTALSSLGNTNTINLNSSAASSIAQLNTSATINLSNAIGLTGTGNNFNVLANTTTLSGVISGTGGFTKSGSGILIIGGNNNYSGGTTVNTGTLSVTDANGLGTGVVNLAPTAGQAVTLDLTTLSSLGNTNTINLNSSAAGSSVNFATSPTITLTNAIGLTGTANNFDVAANTTTLNGVISGTGGFTKSGDGILVIGGNNNYSGGTTVNDGTLSVTHTNGLGTGVVNLAPTTGQAVTLDLTTLSSLGNTNTINLNSSAAGSSVNFATSPTITLTNAIGLTGTANNFDVAANTTTLNGVISGTGGFTKSGDGILVIGGNNNYSGGTTVNDGTVSVTNTNGLGTGVVNLAPTAGQDVTLDLTALSSLGNTNTINLNSSAAGSSVTFATSPTITLANAIGLTGTDNTFDVAANTTTLNGVISGTGGFDKSGSGILIIGGNNTYAGTTTVDAGTLQVANAGGLGTTAGGTVVNSGATLTLAGVNVGGENITLDNATLNGSGTSGSSGAVVLADGTTNNINSSSGNLTLSGVVSGTGVTLDKDGAGKVTLANNGNTYTGTTNINDGTLAATASGALGNSIVNIAPDAGNTAVLDLSAISSLTNPNAINFNSSAAGSTAQLLTTNTITLANAISLTGTDNEFNVTANTTTLNGVISGNGYTKLGDGILIIGGANTYTGTTTVDAGTLQIANASGLGTTAGGTIVNSGAELALAGVNIGGENITLNGGTLSGTGTSGLTGTITLGNGTDNIISANSGDMTLGGAINGNADLTLQGGGNLILGANIGSGTPLNSLTIDTLLNLAANVALTATNIDINNGVSGAGLDLAVNGHDIAFTGPVSLDTLSFTGTGSNNSLALDTGNPQTWTLTGADSGTIDTSGIISGLFSNIQNIMGGSGTDNFVLGGGTLSGDVTGGSGGGTVTGGSGALIWNIIGVDTVTVTGISGILHNMKNLVGGSAGNQFIFANNSKITGSINGGDVSGSNINTLNFQGYTNPVNVTLTSNKFNGSAENSNHQNIVSYTNINDLVGNPGSPSTLTPTAEQRSQVVITGPTSGYIGDPLTWSGFLVSGPLPPPPVPPTPDIINGADVSPIIQQPIVNNSSDGTDQTVNWAQPIDQNIQDVIGQIKSIYDKDLSKVVINPYCNSSASF